MTEWNRDDLPSLGDLQIMGLSYSSNDNAAAKVVLDTVVEHLNVKHPKPDGDLQAVVNEGIRMKRLYNERRKACEAAERARDAAVARAERAERERAEIKEDARKWIPAYGGDPAVHVVRESDIAAVKVTKTSDGGWSTPEACTPSVGSTSAQVRETLRNEIQIVTECEAIARAIEGEQSVDPVEEKARELWEASRDTDNDPTWQERLDAIDDLTIENSMDRAFAADDVERMRRLARHQIGQGASSDA